MPKLEATYTKKLGLPHFSSHCFSVTIKDVEIENVGQASEQTVLLYKLLQATVDEQIKDVGLVPDPRSYGKVSPADPPPANVIPPPKQWACSEAQQAAIVDLTRERGLSKRAVNDLAVDKFRVGVRELNQRQAAGFIKQLGSLATKDGIVQAVAVGKV